MSSVLQGTVYPAVLTAGSDLTGSTVTLTVTAPDGAATTPVTTTTGTTSTAAVPATQVGTYLLVWSLAGATSGAVQDQFSAVAPEVELVSVSDLKRLLHINDLSKDDDLRWYLRAATRVVENVTGTIRPVTRTVTVDGSTGVIVLPDHHVSKITSVTEWNGATSIPLTEQLPGFAPAAYGYVWDRTTNLIRRTAGWGSGLFARTVTIVYVAGLTTIPDDIQLAVTRLIGHWYRKNDNRAPGGRSFGQANSDDLSMPGNYMIPNEVMELLEGWRKPPGIA